MICKLSHFFLYASVANVAVKIVEETAENVPSVVNERVVKPRIADSDAMSLESFLSA